jgi:hypothetical protein
LNIILKSTPENFIDIFLKTTFGGERQALFNKNAPQSAWILPPDKIRAPCVFIAETQPARAQFRQTLFNPLT